MSNISEVGFDRQGTPTIRIVSTESVLALKFPKLKVSRIVEASECAAALDFFRRLALGDVPSEDAALTRLLPPSLMMRYIVMPWQTKQLRDVFGVRTVWDAVTYSEAADEAAAVAARPPQVFGGGNSHVEYVVGHFECRVSCREIANGKWPRGLIWVTQHALYFLSGSSSGSAHSDTRALRLPLINCVLIWKDSKKEITVHVDRLEDFEVLPPYEFKSPIPSELLGRRRARVTLKISDAADANTFNTLYETVLFAWADALLHPPAAARGVSGFGTAGSSAPSPLSGRSALTSPSLVSAYPLVSHYPLANVHNQICWPDATSPRTPAPGSDVPFDDALKLADERAASTRSLTRTDVIRVLNAWLNVDAQAAGTITREQFAKALGHGLTARGSAIGSALFNVFDVDRDGMITCRAFLRGMVRLLRPGGASAIDRIHLAFRAFSERDELISITSFTALLQLLAQFTSNLLPSGKAVTKIVQSIDTELPGLISFQEFIEALEAGTLAPYVTADAIQVLGGDPRPPPKGRFIILGDPEWHTVTQILAGVKQTHEVFIKAGLTRVDTDHYTTKIKVDVCTTSLIAIEGCSACPNGRPVASRGETPRMCDIPRAEQYRFTEYAPAVFRKLRRHFGISETTWLESLGIDQLVSNLILGQLSSLVSMSSSGQSGSFFFASFDGRFILKSMKETEFYLLRELLEQYASYVLSNPDTLITRYYALYSLVLPSMGKMTFIVMNNLLNGPEHEDVNIMFDLKGSFVKRSTPVAMRAPGMALKDQDFEQMRDVADFPIRIDPSIRSDLIDQCTRDSAFLRKLGLIDYSILLGIHTIAVSADTDRPLLTGSNREPRESSPSRPSGSPERGLFESTVETKKASSGLVHKGIMAAKKGRTNTLSHGGLSSALFVTRRGGGEDGDRAAVVREYAAAVMRSRTALNESFHAGGISRASLAAAVAKVGSPLSPRVLPRDGLQSFRTEGSGDETDQRPAGDDARPARDKLGRRSVRIDEAPTSPRAHAADPAATPTGGPLDLGATGGLDASPPRKFGDVYTTGAELESDPEGPSSRGARTAQASSPGRKTGKRRGGRREGSGAPDAAGGAAGDCLEVVFSDDHDHTQQRRTARKLSPRRDGSVSHERSHPHSPTADTAGGDAAPSPLAGTPSTAAGSLSPTSGLPRVVYEKASRPASSARALVSPSPEAKAVALAIANGSGALAAAAAAAAAASAAAHGSALSSPTPTAQRTSTAAERAPSSRASVTPSRSPPLSGPLYDIMTPPPSLRRSGAPADRELFAWQSPVEVRASHPRGALATDSQSPSPPLRLRPSDFIRNGAAPSSIPRAQLLASVGPYSIAAPLPTGDGPLPASMRSRVSIPLAEPLLHGEPLRLRAGPSEPLDAQWDPNGPPVGFAPSASIAASYGNPASHSVASGSVWVDQGHTGGASYPRGALGGPHVDPAVVPDSAPPTREGSPKGRPTARRRGAAAESSDKGDKEREGSKGRKRLVKKKSTHAASALDGDDHGDGDDGDRDATERSASLSPARSLPKAASPLRSIPPSLDPTLMSPTAATARKAVGERWLNEMTRPSGGHGPSFDDAMGSGKVTFAAQPQRSPSNEASTAATRTGGRVAASQSPLPRDSARRGAGADGSFGEGPGDAASRERDWLWTGSRSPPRRHPADGPINLAACHGTVADIPGRSLSPAGEGSVSRFVQWDVASTVANGPRVAGRSRVTAATVDDMAPSLLAMPVVNSVDALEESVGIRPYARRQDALRDLMRANDEMTRAESMDRPAQRNQTRRTPWDSFRGGILSSDGKEIYYIGIIDILTRYTFVKRIEHHAKALRYPAEGVSCTDPTTYSRRFSDFMTSKVFPVIEDEEMSPPTSPLHHASPSRRGDWGRGVGQDACGRGTSSDSDDSHDH